MNLGGKQKNGNDYSWDCEVVIHKTDLFSIDP